jgi:steroid 5-alpha reductase family enzyme
VGDAQLAAFKRDPGNRGRVMDRGLWAWTRHPNYFGDATLWWGLGLFALATPGAWWTLAGPALMTTLLVRVSGVALLERTLNARPGYREYVARTSPFFPLPPRRG